MCKRNSHIFLFLFVIVAIPGQGCLHNPTNRDDNDTSTEAGLISERETINSDRLFYVKRTAGNMVPIYFSIGDTIPTWSMHEPHIALYYGNPNDFHATAILMSNKVFGESDMVALFGIIDEQGEFKATLKADTAKGEFITIQAKNEFGRCKYKFTPFGIGFNSNPVGGKWFMTSNSGTTGDVLQYTPGDTAKFQKFTHQAIDSVSIYTLESPAIGQTAFCTDCTPLDKTEEGVVVTYNGYIWHKHW